jgi:hypothetical protein
VRARVSFSLVLALLLCTLPLTAQQCDEISAQPKTSAEALLALRRLDTASCLGGSKCAIAPCAHFTTWNVVRDGAGALEVLTDARNSAASAGSSANVTKLQQRIDAWTAAIGKDAIATLDAGKWKYDNEGLFRETPFAIDINGDVTARCAKGESDCITAFKEAMAIITSATLVRRVNGVLLADQRDALVTYVTGLDQRWDDYFNRAPSQFPWELAVNSAIYRKHERRGFNEPPSWQLITFHPTPAYEYASDAKDKFKSALALEMIGYFAHHAGASLSTVWSDRSDGKKFGYGVTVHWEGKLTLGLMHHNGSGGTSILVSPNAEKFIAGGIKRVREVLTKQ